MVEKLRKKQVVEALTAMVASALLHQKSIIIGAKQDPPTPAESKDAYLNDPAINKFTDAVVFGMLKIFSMGQSSDREKLMLESVQMAYRKHWMNDDSIGWSELGDTLANNLAEVMGDYGFQAWLAETRSKINRQNNT